MRYALLIILVLFSGSLIAAVYKWVDPQGNVHYSDIPDDPNAEQLDLPEYSRYQPRLPDVPPETVPAAGGDQPASPVAGQAGSPAGTVLEIVQPEKDATIRNNQGNVPVVLLLNPSLEEGQYLQLMLDGTPVEGRHTSTSMQLVGVLRGPHVLQARLMDKSGRTLARSDSLRFYMRQASRFEPKRSATDPGNSGATGPAGNTFKPAASDPDYTPSPNAGNFGGVGGAGNTFKPSFSPGYKP